MGSNNLGKTDALKNLLSHERTTPLGNLSNHSALRDVHANVCIVKLMRHCKNGTS